MNIFKKSLAMFLVLCMLVSAVPVTVFASEGDSTNPVVTEPNGEPTVDPEDTLTQAVANSEGVYTGKVEAPSEFLKVFHLDSGRKYFTVDEVKAILDTLCENGYSHMELVIGNEGMRFLLDDMTIEANGTTYSSDAVKAAIQSGNETYGHSGEWTQAEMKSIISYAKSRGIEIIPLLNSPGHMNTILNAMKTLGIDSPAYSTSARTIDLTNEEAIAFTQAFVKKYMAYFASEGSTYFNIGGDEYANDAAGSDSNGWVELIDDGNYNLFIDYINELVAAADGYGLRPIAFNDGIYYNGTTNFGTFDTRLIISYWTGGYPGYYPASAATLSSKNHLILNTSDMWYYVMGRSALTDTYGYPSAKNNASWIKVDSVSGAIGSMQCVWCDDPSVSYSETEQSRVTTLIETMAKFNPTYFTGPNEIVPETPTEPPVETPTEPPVENDPSDDKPVDLDDPATGIVISAPGLTDLTITEATAPVIEAAAEGKVLAWDMTPANAGGAYVGEAVVAVPVPQGWDGNNMGAFVIEDGTVTLIDGALNEEGNFEFKMPHFSVGGVYEIAPVANQIVNIELEIGETSEVYTDNSGYYTTAEGLNNAVATVVLGGNAYIESTATYTKATNIYCSTLLDSDQRNWTAASGYYYTPDNGANYYPVYAKRTSSGQWSTTTYTYTWGYSTTNSASNVTQIGTTNQSVNDSNYDWNDGPTKTKPSITVYTVTGTEAVPAKTTVSFTGVSVGNTSATIGNTTYNIVVKKKAEAATITVGESMTFEDSSASAVVKDSNVASATIANGTLTVTAKAVGTTTVTTDNAVYTITVVDFDLSTVTPLEIEYWITNHPVMPDNQTANTSYVDHNGKTQTNYQRIWIEIAASVEGIYSANGVELKNLVAASGVDSHMHNNVVYWKGVALNSSEHQQTTDANDNESFKGVNFTKIRYWKVDGEKEWQVYNGTTWISVTDDTQLVAYYLQKTVVTNLDVIQTEVVDWGEVHGVSSYNDANFVAMDFAIQYEDGTRNPNAFPVSGKTLKFHCDYNNALNQTVFKDGSYYYRRIGTIKATETSNYEVYMITITPNNDNNSTGSSYIAGNSANSLTNLSSKGYAGTEKVIWVDDAANLGKFEDTNLQHADFTVGGEPIIEKVDIYNKHAVLITYYVRAKVTQDSLTVHYMDRTAGDAEFYNYNIAVNEGTKFNENIGLNNPWKGALKNGTVQTIDAAVQQTVSADLDTLPQIAAQYEYSDYQCVEVTRSADGKHVYLYYTFNNIVNFVADFGLPLKISGTDLHDTLAGQVSDISFGGGSYTTYGQLTDNGPTITYTPNKIMQGSDSFTLNVTTDDGVVAYRVFVYPATTVYYEESFVNWDDKWSGGNTKPTATQTTAILGEDSNNYGYDGVYADGALASTVTSATTSTINAKGTFTFTGNGIQVFANCTEGSGYVSVQVKGADDKFVNVSMVDTAVSAGDTGATSGQSGNLNGLPVVSLVDLQNIPHGTYTVSIIKIMDNEPVYIDGIRVFNTIKEPEEGTSIFTEDLEDHPNFYELRDHVLNAIGVEDLTKSDYIDDPNSKADNYEPSAVKDMANQVYNAVAGGSAIITDESVTYDNSANVQDLLDNGPKNELYLYAGQTLTFKVTTNRVMQVGLKAPQGGTKVSINGAGEKEINSSVDMFYTVAEKLNSETAQTITIKNTGDKILSVTLLKICDDPSFGFVPFTVEDIETILVGDVEEETPSEPSKPGKPEADKPGNNKPAEPSKPGKPETDKPGNNKPAEPSKPEANKPGNNKPGQSSQNAQKEAKLKIYFVNFLGKKVGSATISKMGTANQPCMFSVSEIVKQAPAGRLAIWLLNVTVNYGNTTSIIVPVI